MQQILGYVTLTKAIQQTTSGIPNPLPPAFMNSRNKVVGNSAKFVSRTGERRTMKLSRYGSPARKADLRDVSERDVKLLHVYEEQTLNPFTFLQLRDASSYQQDTALNEVKRQITEFSAKAQNTRIAAVQQVLRTGKLYWDSEGNLLPTSSGAQDSFDFGVNANNQNQLNGIITASWALNTTDIPLQLRNLRKRAVRLTGYPLKYALYGENVPSYMSQNNFVLDYMSRNPTMQASWLASAEIPAGLFGFVWVPMYESFYEDSAGTNQDLWSGDTIVFTPEPTDEWWDIFEGSYPVPSTVDIQVSAEQALRSMSIVQGQGGYGIATHNPPSATTYMFDTFIPALMNGDVIFQGDCTP